MGGFRREDCTVQEKRWALLFDLDETLVLTSGIKALRDSRRWSDVYRSFGRTLLAPRTLEFLAQWRADTVMGVVTTSPRRYAEKLLEHHRLDLPVLAAYRDTSRHKPDPAPILYALGKIEVAAADSFYVGDLSEDV